MVCYTQAQRIASRVIDGKAVVIVIDKQQLHTFNEVGSFLWQRLGAQSSAASTVAMLARGVVEHFDVSYEVAERDVQAFVSQLVGLGAVDEVHV